MPSERRNFTTHIYDGNIYGVRNSGERQPELFVRTGQTTNIRAVASADAVVYDGLLLDVFADGKRVLFQDPWSGIEARFAAVEWHEPAIVTLDKVERVFASDSSEQATLGEVGRMTPEITVETNGEAAPAIGFAPDRDDTEREEIYLDGTLVLVGCGKQLRACLEERA